MTDANLIADYIAALRASRAPSTAAAEGEVADKRTATVWFAMTVDTQTAARVAAARAGLLDPRVSCDGVKLYPHVDGDRLVWVTVPGRD